MALSYIQGGMISTYDNEGDFFSDLSKALYGYRDHDAASDLYADWKRINPLQIPVVYAGMLWTASALQAELDASEAARQAEIERKRQARIAARREWNDASPMRDAMRKAGLLS